MPAKHQSQNYSLVTVTSGAVSLRSEEHGETFHPVVGPMAEARALHVGQSRLIERSRTERAPLVVWDVGLGAAANAIAVLDAWRDEKVELELHSFDRTLEPLQFACANADALGYLKAWQTHVDALLRGEPARVGTVTWRVHVGDFREMVKSPPAPSPHAILYDPYSPSANPGMWSLEHFARLAAALDLQRPCTLTSYSRSTAVRVTLALAGFHVGQGSATGEKEETTVAATQRELLLKPLGRAWLDRVRRSTRAAPLRECGTGGPISDVDFAALEDRILPTT